MYLFERGAFMIQNMIVELNELKAKREKVDRDMKMKMNHFHEQLRRLDHEIAEMTENIRLERANVKGNDRTVEWNSEHEGTWSVEGSEEKLYEREKVYDNLRIE